MRTRLMSLAVIIGCATSVNASAQDLTIGKTAPPITVAKWVKGERVEQFDSGKTYVVEFWATWCVPCRTSIPQLSAFQKKYEEQGLKCIGVSVFERDRGGIEPYVKEMGDKMNYSVALDDVPADRGGHDGKMAVAWMAAAGEQGIPTAFIIANGKIAWIGPAMALEEPLEKVISGKWDLEAAARDRRKQRDHESKLVALYSKIGQAMRTGESKGTIDAIDAVIAGDATAEEALGAAKFMLLCKSEHYDEAYRYGHRLVTTVLKERTSELNAIAWTIVDPDSRRKVDERDLKLAREAAERANEITRGENPAILDTLARVYFASGELQNAVERQQEAVMRAEEAVMRAVERLDKVIKQASPEAQQEKARIEGNRRAVEEMKSRLEQYRKAAERNNR